MVEWASFGTKILFASRRETWYSIRFRVNQLFLISNQIGGQCLKKLPNSLWEIATFSADGNIWHTITKNRTYHLKDIVWLNI